MATKFHDTKIRNNIITMDPVKINEIQIYETPKNLKELRYFIGLVGHFKGFIRNYAKIIRPLTIHLKSKYKINLDSAALIAFREIKIQFQGQNVLCQPDFGKSFELKIDTDNFSLNSEFLQDGHTITFHSRLLNPKELNYSLEEKEILNIVWTLKKLKNYTDQGIELTIYTNFQYLKRWISEENSNSKMEQWRKILLRILTPI